MQSLNPHIKQFRHVNRTEEQAFLKAISVAIESVFKDDSRSDVKSDTLSTVSEMHGRDELIHVFEAAQQPEQLLYSDTYKIMHDYVNTAVAGVTLHDRDVNVPLNFTAFEIIYRHSVTTKPRVATIPPTPYSFTMK